MSSRERSVKYLRQYIEQLQGTQTDAEPRSLINTLSVRSIYRWIKDYTERGYDIRSLIPNAGLRSDKDRPRIEEAANQVVNDVLKDLYLKRTSISIDELVWEIARRIDESNSQQAESERLTVPSRATVARRIQALDIELKLTAKKGGRTAKRLTTQYGQMVEPTFPLDRVEIDHTVLDVLAIDPADNLIMGRPTLTFCMDVATRLPIGFSVSFEPPSYGTIMDCLMQAIMPKTVLCERYQTKHDWPIYGIPALLVTDNGREFIGNDLADACQCLGIMLEHMPVRTPQFKGTVERLLGTISRTFIHGLPGTTFSNPKEKGDYDSAEQACISLDELTKVLCLFLVDVYSFDLHKGIGTTPYSKFQSLTKNGFAPRLPESRDDLLVLLGRTTTRTIQHYGVDFEGLRYNSDDLSPLRLNGKGKTFKIKYNPHDISRIYVLAEQSKSYLEAPALAAEYTHNLSLWKHRVIQEYARNKFGKVDMVALGRSMQEIRDIVAAGRARQKKVAGKRVARWDTTTTSSAPVIPPVSPTPSSPAPLPLAPASEVNADQDDDTPAWLKAAAQQKWKVDYTLPTIEETRRFGTPKEHNDE